jgi:outer membrane protein
MSRMESTASAMPRWRRSALAVLCALAPLASHGEDLLDIYRRARSADPVLASADAARGVAQESVVQARAALLPQLSAGLSFNEMHDPDAPANDPNSATRSRTRSTTASLSQVVVDLGKVSQWKGTQAQADAQEATYRAAEQALYVRVATAYFGALTAADALTTTLANEDAFRQQVEQAEERYRNGLSALVDLDQARSFHAAARANTIAARTSLADAREALTEITGSPPGELKTLRDDLPTNPPFPADPQAWVSAAVRDNPALQAQQRSVAAAEEAIETARSGHLPTLTAGVDVGRGAGWPLPVANTDGRTVTTVGVVLKVPLFAGGAIQSQVRQALYQRDRAREELERQRRQIGRDTLDRYRSVLAGIGQISATREAFEAARKALDSTRVGRQLGTQTMTDLLLAIQNLASAQGTYSSVRHQFVLNRMLLQQAAGAVGEADLAAVNALLQ